MKHLIKNSLVGISIIMNLIIAFYPADVLGERTEGIKIFSKSSDMRFIDLNNGVIQDTKTNLMWMKQDIWQMKGKWVNWFTAHEYIQNLNHRRFAGYSDWRFPTPEEAETLYNRRKRNIDKDGDKIFLDPIFPKGAGWATWTGHEKENKAMIVYFKNEGERSLQDKIKGPDAFLRPVRGPVTNSSVSKKSNEMH